MNKTRGYENCMVSVLLISIVLYVSSVFMNVSFIKLLHACNNVHVFVVLPLASSHTLAITKHKVITLLTDLEVISYIVRLCGKGNIVSLDFKSKDTKLLRKCW